MKVYIVFEDDSETNGMEIIDIFISKEKAEECLNKHREHWGSYYLDEYDVTE